MCSVLGVAKRRSLFFSGQFLLTSDTEHNTNMSSVPEGHMEQTEWIEKQAIPELGFRIWHIMFFCLSVMLIFVILICCCVKIRIPRTKQEIEADYQRKKIVKKFRQRLRLIQNSDMDNMDLKLALDRVQNDFETESRKIMEALNGRGENMKAEPQQPVNMGSATKTFSMLMSLTTNAKNKTTSDTQSEDTNLKV